MIKAELNVPVEVTRSQYIRMKGLFTGICAFRSENGRHWIKRLWPGYRKEVESFLN